MSTLLEQASLVMIPSGYKEDVVYSQIPTSGAGDLSFTRASNGTRINSAGLVEVVPWNLLGNSENGTTPNWGNPYHISSVTANSTTAPNGTNTGNLVVEDSANSTHWFETSFSAIFGTPYTMSVYFKAKERTQCALYGFTDNFVFSGQLVIFNLSTGTVVSQSGTQTNAIENVGNGWYRCSMTITANASATAYFGGGLANGGNQSYQGDGTSGLYMWGRQLNTGTLKPYFPTTDRLNVPRLTYQNGGGGCPSLLLEKQSTNIVLQSQALATTPWQGFGGAISDNSAISPDGTQNANTLSRTGGGAGCYQSCGVDAGASYTATMWAKLGTATNICLVINNSIAWNTVGGESFTTSNGLIANQWARVQFTFTAPVNGNINIHIGEHAQTGLTPQSEGSYFIYGVQIEKSSYPTSYISTTSASATRVADACSKTGISSLIGTNQGTFFVDIANAIELDFPQVTIDDNSNTNRIVLYREATNGYWSIFLSAGGSTASYSSTVSSINGKFAIAYNSSGFLVYKDGVQILSFSNTVPSSLSAVRYNGRATGDFYTNKEIKEFVLFPTKLTATELAQLTA